MIHETLQLDLETPITFTHMRLEGWGKTLIFTGQAQNRHFRLIFDEIREMRWRTYAHLDVNQPTSLVEFKTGRDQHRSPAQMLTDHFGLSLFYGTLEIKEQPATNP